MAGLGSVMFIARQVAYTPTAASRRAKTADIINQISDELRYATVITQQTAQILEFVVADRNNDGTAEKIRYEWSGVAGDPLRKTVNGGTAVDVLTSVYAFNVTLQQKSKTTTLTTTTDSSEAQLLGNASVVTGSYRDIDTSNYCAVQITPTALTGIPANALVLESHQSRLPRQAKWHRDGNANRAAPSHRRSTRRPDKQRRRPSNAGRVIDLRH